MYGQNARRGRGAAGALGLLLLGSLLGLGLRLVAFVVATAGVRLTGSLSGLVPLVGASLDPVYTHAALRSLADLHLQGLAVAGPVGGWLHATWPSMFVDSSRAHWAPLRLAVEPGSSVLGRLVAATIAHATVLGNGLWIVRASWRRRAHGWLRAGVGMQIQVALGILGAPPSPRELETTGVSFAANALLPSAVQRGNALTDPLNHVWSPVLAAGLVGLALCVGYLPAALAVVLRGRARALTMGTATAVVLIEAAITPRARARIVATLMPRVPPGSVQPAAADGASGPRRCFAPPRRSTRLSSSCAPHDQLERIAVRIHHPCGAQTPVAI